MYQSTKPRCRNRHKHFQQLHKFFTNYQPLTPDGRLLIAESGA